MVSNENRKLKIFSIQESILNIYGVDTNYQHLVSYSTSFTH